MTHEFSPTVHLMASRRNGTRYAGVTSNLLQRVAQHRQGLLGGFTDVHAVKMLIGFEKHETMDTAILREKRNKAWRRAWKLRLIETTNPGWRDLALDYGFEPFRKPDSRLRGNDEET